MIKKIKKQIAELDAVLSDEIERRWALEKEFASIKLELGKEIEKIKEKLNENRKRD